MGQPSRASSTKTRIETSVGTWDGTYKFPIKSKFHENKDWNIVKVYSPIG